MFGSTGPVGTDPTDIDIAGHRIRLLSDEPSVTDALRAAFEHDLVDQPAPPGFMIQSPDGNRRLHVLVDHSGFVLARARTAAECVAVLAGHLGALLPAPAGTVRSRLRALIGHDSNAVLAGFPLFTTPPVVERQLVRHGFRIVDRLVTDLTPAGELVMTPSAWPELSAAGDLDGHAPVSGDPVRICALVLPQTGPGVPTFGQFVAFLASTFVAAPPDVAMVLAEEMAGRRIVAVPLDDRAALHDALRTLR